MILAVDYDETYDMDFGLWEAFAKLATGRGHTVICVTCRALPPGSADPHERVPSFPVYCTANQQKRPFMEALGIRVDVWIDDFPESIASYASSGGLLLPNKQ
jgi:hypothetical protein